MSWEGREGGEGIYEVFLSYNKASSSPRGVPDFIFRQAELQGIALPVEKPEDLRPWLIGLKEKSTAEVATAT